MPGINDCAEEYFAFINNKEFPCVAARAALHKDHIRIFVADHMACPKNDRSIINFMYSFVDEFRNSSSLFTSAVVIFKGPDIFGEQMFDQLLWQRLQSFANIDNQ